jgi:hypothetical protein
VEVDMDQLGNDGFFFVSIDELFLNFKELTVNLDTRNMYFDYFLMLDDPAPPTYNIHKERKNAPMDCTDCTRQKVFVTSSVE